MNFPAFEMRSRAIAIWDSAQEITGYLPDTSGRGPVKVELIVVHSNCHIIQKRAALMAQHIPGKCFSAVTVSRLSGAGRRGKTRMMHCTRLPKVIRGAEAARTFERQTTRGVDNRWKIKLNHPGDAEGGRHLVIFPVRRTRRAGMRASNHSGLA